MKIIAKIHTDMPEKFGIPRQSGIVKELTGTIVFEPEYRVREALVGIEEFSHLWLLWQFSENLRDDWSPTVRPPRLGGEKRKGVFATRSPFRPNPIGLSCVELIGVEHTKNFGTVLHVGGVDLMNGTPIYDIKPYITYTDCHTDAVQGFAEDFKNYALEVIIPEKFINKIPEDKQNAVIGILKHDPRPAYQNDPNRVYGVSFDRFNIKFTVSDKTLTVVDIEDL
ncbi:MAG: tRNA (N6-threonylcarbamoyladenosine(37)-N6)-methyltransferase TrmO [Clostridiales bacterium]|nr:tRNA (N6-threonylcarbamoyladenosine(37)-N6)-methyltransferase TrmO [Clostridiales bacterium]